MHTHSKLRIIALVGSIGSGKGSISSYLQEKYQAEVHMYSSPLRSILNILGQETSREQLSQLSTTLRSLYGQDILEQSAIARIERQPSGILILDGVRRIQDITAIMKLDGFALWYIDAPIETRYERSVGRNQNTGDDKKSLQEFINDDQSESESQIRSLKPYAHVVIDNIFDQESLYNCVERHIKG